LSVVFINKKHELFYCQGNKCEPLNQRIKHEPIVANLDPRKVITHSFKIPLNISVEELEIEVEMKLFDEAGLSAYDDYKIDYVIKEQNIDKTENMVEAFAIKVSDIEEQFGAMLPKRIKHIDLLSVPYISYQGLYEKKVLQPKNDVFVHLDKDVSYIVLCTEGKYIYARNINDLQMLSNGIDEGFNLDVDAYTQLLHTKGLQKDLYSEDEAELYDIIESQFQAICNRINDTVMYNRNIFGFEKADRIFIDCADGWINGIDHFIHRMMFDKAQVLSLREHLNIKNTNLSTADCIFVQYAMLHLQIKPNLTIYSRKKPLHKTFFAKLLYTVAVTTIVVSVYPLFLLYQRDELLQSIESQKQVLQHKQSQHKAISQEIEKIQEEMQKYEDDIEAMRSEQRKMSDTIQTFIQIDQNNAYDLEFIIDATNSLQNFGLHITAMEKIDGAYSLSVYTAYETRDLVTMLMEQFIKLGYSSVQTDRIYTEDERYNATLKIAR